MLPNTACGCTLLMNHVRGSVWACRGPSTTHDKGAAWARLCNEVVVVTAMTKAHCQGHIGAVEGSVQREARHNTRHASILCASMSPGGGWRDWVLHGHKEPRRCQSRREAAGPGKEDSQGMS